jgi:hypothetical protein
MEAALTAIELLKPGEKFTYQAIADQFGVQRSTLSQRHQGCQSTVRDIPLFPFTVIVNAKGDAIC